MATECTYIGMHMCLSVRISRVFGVEYCMNLHSTVYQNTIS